MSSCSVPSSQFVSNARYADGTGTGIFFHDRMVSEVNSYCTLWAGRILSCVQSKTGLSSETTHLTVSWALPPWDSIVHHDRQNSWRHWQRDKGTQPSGMLEDQAMPWHTMHTQSVIMCVTGNNGAIKKLLLEGANASLQKCRRLRNKLNMWCHLYSLSFSLSTLPHCRPCLLR